MSEKTTKKGRGRTKMIKSWGDENFEVQINDLNQAIGENAAKLSRQMGCVAKNGSRFPLTVTDSRKIDKSSKEITWLENKANFSLEDNLKKSVLKEVGRNVEESEIRDLSITTIVAASLTLAFVHRRHRRCRELPSLSFVIFLSLFVYFSIFFSFRSKLGEVT
ncbi:PREDICTED: uncharacterized protein LOC105967353 [Erythranthe guttata]|uniref:uncharacterized protein LOC105967353 n=1 Tax=Erythranthe guttata TaxID=4155 RepID=UPI00064DFAF9|nr:PREDICTED: uncharacterized protein LOC105967353 [Erythranthe guttata]|eukprot:XP_012847409.1 PREDICTED: uncharacterized protein LOC105967353 [Erythranthe guttata]